MDCWLGRDGGGRLTATACGLSVPRQNGKNGAIEAFEFFMLLNVPKTHILHTAHQVKTAKKAFNRLAGTFEDRRHPELQAELDTVRRTNGEETIALANGNTIEYASRSRGGGRGFDAITCVVYDEAQELTEEQVEALMSTLAASPTGDRQIVYAGTPPGPNAPGGVFGRVRAAAMSGGAPEGMAWHEWGAPGDACPVGKGASFADVLELAYATNPAMGRRLSERFTAQEFATMAPEGFARERLGWWEPGRAAADDRAVPQEAWDACATREPVAQGAEASAFGVKFSPDGQEVAVAACTLAGDAPRVELAADRATAAGTGWLREAMRADPGALWVVDGRAGAGALVDAVRPDLGDRVRLASAGDAMSAAAGLLDAVRERAVEIYAAPDGRDRLSESAGLAVRRPIGGNGGWGFGGDCAPVEAAALALWGARAAGPRYEEMAVYF